MPKTTPRGRALVPSAMILLAPRLADRPRRAVRSVGRPLLRCLLRHLPRCLEEALGCVPVSGLAQQRGDQLPVPVDRPVEVRPDASDLEGGFLPMPGAASLTLARGAQLGGHEGREAPSRP